MVPSFSLFLSVLFLISSMSLGGVIRGMRVCFQIPDFSFILLLSVFT